MNPLNQAVSLIIKEQQQIIGPLAIDQAKKVPGITVISPQEVQLTGDGKTILTNLVNEYSKIFGQASIQVCKEALAPVIDKLSPNDLPDIFKS